MSAASCSHRTSECEKLLDGLRSHATICIVAQVARQKLHINMTHENLTISQRPNKASFVKFPYVVEREFIAAKSDSKIHQRS